MQTCRNILTTGLESLQLPVDEEKLEKLMAFIRLIEKWNKTYNLTSICNREDMARLHILDSLAILPYVRAHRVLDIGTGAGLPGIPLALFLTDYEFVLVDSKAKKTRFVQQVIIELQLDNVQACHSRVESYSTKTRFDTVISRAFASLQDFIAAGENFLTDSGVLLAMKGQNPTDELQRINRPYTVENIQVPGVDVERCLVQLTRYKEAVVYRKQVK